MIRSRTPMESKYAFATVGTTQFEALIRALDTPEVAALLQSRGFSELRLQIGNCTYVPHVIRDSGSSLLVTWYDYKPSLAEDLQAASLIISHAGAGTVLEAMRQKRPLLVVINESLMDNHQAELAEALEALDHLRHTSVHGLVAALAAHPLCPGAPFPDAESERFCAILDEETGRA